MNTNSVNLNPDDFLASKADLIGVLAILAGSRNLNSSRRRNDQQLAQTALSRLIASIPADASRETVAGKAATASVSHSHISSGPSHGISGAGRRQHCQCGRCKPCLDNARWERIFNEKFADPGYYNGPMVRHSSSLGEAR
jgi:hypothetical protein